MGHVMSIGGMTDYEDLNMKMRGIGKKYGQGCILQAFTGFYGDIEASVLHRQIISDIIGSS